MNVPLLESRGLEKSFASGRTFLGRERHVHVAVDGVDLVVDRGETLAIVGESGAGKSTVGRLVLRLIEPDRGEVRLDGVDVLSLSSRDLRSTRRRMQMIFQDPYSSLNPRMSIEAIVGEPLTLHLGLKGKDRFDRVLQLLDRVGIGEHQVDRLPYEFSGGQLQRVAIARALAVEPDLIVCDEPVAALDASIQAQVINLLSELQRESHVAYIFISHDLSLVRLIATWVAVMYRGRIVEEGPPAEIYGRPRHPYTRALLSVIPVPDPRCRSSLNSAVASNEDAARVSEGCAYATRCPMALDVCWRETPVLSPVGLSGRVSCHRADETVVVDGLGSRLH